MDPRRRKPRLCWLAGMCLFCRSKQWQGVGDLQLARGGPRWISRAMGGSETSEILQLGGRPSLRESGAARRWRRERRAARRQKRERGRRPARSGAIRVSRGLPRICTEHSKHHIVICKKIRVLFEKWSGANLQPLQMGGIQSGCHYVRSFNLSIQKLVSRLQPWPRRCEAYRLDHRRKLT
jgi:hypothetical protein